MLREKQEFGHKSAKRAHPCCKIDVSLANMTIERVVISKPFQRNNKASYKYIHKPLKSLQTTAMDNSTI